jgi:lactate dehydrogenase-like 2-hydroxyacid dehydrogenase
VFDGEPKIHPGYYSLENAFLLPHMGSATVETRNAMGFKALDNLEAFLLRGQTPPDLVTPS